MSGWTPSSDILGSSCMKRCALRRASRCSRETPATWCVRASTQAPPVGGTWTRSGTWHRTVSGAERQGPLATEGRRRNTSEQSAEALVSALLVVSTGSASRGGVARAGGAIRVPWRRKGALARSHTGGKQGTKGLSLARHTRHLWGLGPQAGGNYRVEQPSSDEEVSYAAVGGAK